MREGKTSSTYFICVVAMLLVAQLAIVRGHVHFPNAHHEHAQAAPLSKSGDGSPGKQHPGHIDVCPLCWAQAAAGGLLLPGGVVLPHPAQIGDAQFAASGHLAELIQPTAFKPRGPPLT